MVCLYLGNAASRQFRKDLCLANIPVLLSRIKVFIILYLCLTNIPIILDKQNKSLYCNIKNLSLIYAMMNIEQENRKYKS